MASFFPCVFCLLLLQHPLFNSAQKYQNVALGSSLSTQDANSSWDSPSGEFSFGFRPTQGNFFFLAIWFAKISVKTIVWTANKGNPVQRGSEVQLTSNGVLSLISPSGTVVWKAESSNGSHVTSAAMLDSGNFVLSRHDSSIGWASFDHPTDTLLPGQILDLGGKLIAPVTEENYRPGRFELILQTDRNLVLYPLIRPTEDHYDAYWESNTLGYGLQLVFNQSGYIYLALMDGGRFRLTPGIPVSTKNFYHRATLDFDGVFRQYTYPKSSRDGSWPQSWSFAWSIPEDICTTDFGEFGSGVCGFNSYCKIENQRPTCECPPGYIYTDSTNIFRGCKQNFVTLSCEPDRLRAGVGYEMRQLPNTDWPRGDYEWFKSVTEDFCRETCLNDCLCAAAITREQNCWLKKFPLSNGRFDPSLRGKALIKVSNSTTE